MDCRFKRSHTSELRWSEIWEKILCYPEEYLNTLLEYFSVWDTQVGKLWWGSDWNRSWKCTYRPRFCHPPRLSPPSKKPPCQSSLFTIRPLPSNKHPWGLIKFERLKPNSIWIDPHEDINKNSSVLLSVIQLLMFSLLTKIHNKIKDKMKDNVHD